MESPSSKRLRLFLKTAGGATAVAKKTGINKATFSNIMRKGSKPSFPVTQALIKAYPVFNLRWWFIGEEPMWLDKPTNVDQDLVNYVEENKPSYSTPQKQDYTSYNKDQLIQLLKEKDSFLNNLLTGKNESLYVAKEQLNVLQKILQKIDLQGATLGDTETKHTTKV